MLGQQDSNAPNDALGAQSKHDELRRKSQLSVAAQPSVPATTERSWLAQLASPRAADPGLWVQNPALVMLLGLCPLLAVSTTLINGCVLGFATLVTLTVSNLSISALRNWIPRDLRLPIFVTVVATVVTIVDLLLMTWAFSLHRQLGLFIPLIVTNCAVLARAEAFASRQPVIASARDGIGMGLGFMLALVALGALREVIGHASLGRDAHLLLGGLPASWVWNFNSDAHAGMLIAVLPPGAFFGLALFCALRQWPRKDAQDKTTLDR
jgi:Na+-translocating ferredoxin:NAD+ oxidoreductase subunit E